jgi:hypothetical protein
MKAAERLSAAEVKTAEDRIAAALAKIELARGEDPGTPESLLRYWNSGPFAQMFVLELVVALLEKETP